MLKLFHSFRTENKFKNYKNIYNNHDCCCVEMHKDDNKILKYHGEESMKVLFVIYADMEPLIETISTCNNNP